MDLGLKGKRVIVTGGTRGIGAAIVSAFLAEGARVAFCARSASEVAASQAAHKAAGHDTIAAAVDVSDAAAYTGWLSECLEALGGADIFVPNVSGGAGPGEAGWKSVFEVDMMAMVRGADLILPHMAKAGGGAIVAISSIAALEALGGAGPYGAMKAALTSYASQLGADAARYGVRVNTVSPGPIHVEDGYWGMVRRERPELYKGAVARQPFGRLGTTEEVAACVVFLASPAASWVTRANLVVDGGFSQRVQF
ncbi:MAG: SDR family oxidoreductase [Alphaproteobacteria bacterium]|nr:MAG: SDR family oxidoreductase [Alphaproteobacteria bacterium]